MELTEQFSQECAAARNHCALFNHPNRGVIEVRGEDRVTFLHNILSNDIKNLTAGKGTAACFLNAQAKIIAGMNVLCFDEFLWLALEYSLKNKLVESLNKIIIMEQVELMDRSEELKLISIHGPKAKTLLEIVLNQEAPEELLSHKTMAWEGIRITAIRINLTGEIGYGILIPKNNASSFESKLDQCGAPLGLIHIQAASLETLRIEAGIPRYGVDFDESHIPLEAGLEKTVSFTKGCFPGQEILARLDSRGGVSKKLCGLVLKGEVAAKKNARVTKEDNEVGYITSSIFSPTLKKTIAMGYLAKEYWKPGSPVVVTMENTKIPARVASLPFYSPHKH